MNILKIAVLSDIHCEFHRDNGRSFVNSLDPTGVDILALAGDINIAKNRLLIETLNLFSSRFSNSKIIYIHGNHTFYGSKREFVLDQTREAVKRNPNLIWLDNEVVFIDGKRFIGAPMWFPYNTENIKYEKNLNDFSQIEGYKDWVYAENQKTMEFLNRELREGDVVITHHLPSNRSVPSQFTGSHLNRFFICDVENIIQTRQPDLWIHGHSHGSCDYMIGKSRIICNPFGYARFEENIEFNERLIIKLHK